MINDEVVMMRLDKNRTVVWTHAGQQKTASGKKLDQTYTKINIIQMWFGPTPVDKIMVFVKKIGARFPTILRTRQQKK